MDVTRRTAIPKSGGGVEDEIPDVELVRRAQQSPRAFEALYLRYLDAVIAYCSYRLPNRTEAEDAASAIFLKTLHGLPSFRLPSEDGSFRSWLFSIAHNEVADRCKYRSRHPQAPFEQLIDAVSLEQAPEEYAIASDGHAHLRALLRLLPPRERAVLELRAADLTTKEIAAILAISEQNVRTAQCRAVTRMREFAGASGLIDRGMSRG
jgi:RNA polymerase sigma-70 factor, ECF subfamily